MARWLQVLRVLRSQGREYYYIAWQLLHVWRLSHSELSEQWRGSKITLILELRISLSKVTLPPKERLWKAKVKRALLAAIIKKKYKLEMSIRIWPSFCRVKVRKLKRNCILLCEIFGLLIFPNRFYNVNKDLAGWKRKMKYYVWISKWWFFLLQMWTSEQ